MDADFKKKRRERISSQREKRWSMNSQRLEEIVAELMRPISDLRRSFDTDLSALLEEYLTEAGLHALDEAGDEPLAAPFVAPNFSELALLLQQSASIYGRKVDFLYQHVLSVSDSLHNSTLELANSSGAEPAVDASVTPGRRKRAASPSTGGFERLSLEPSAAARREPGAARPPPTLPRHYVELEPRPRPPHARQLTDYAGEPVGLLRDFHVSWRLHEGLLVEELAAGGGGALRAIPLAELQAALLARAPASPPPAPLSPPASAPPSPPASPPPPPPPSPFACSTPLPPPQPPKTDRLKRDRKRKSDLTVEEMPRIKLLISKEMRAAMGVQKEFALSPRWLAAALRMRTAEVLELRRSIKKDTHSGEFLGWSASEAASATAAALAARPDDSDDDGFFEQSELGDSDASRADDSPTAAPRTADAAWCDGVVARAAAAERRGGVDVRALAARVLHALPTAPPAPVPAAPLLRAEAKHPQELSHLFLATLFLANAGNVEVIPGPRLALDAFSLRLVSADARLYRGADLTAPLPPLSPPPAPPPPPPPR